MKPLEDLTSKSPQEWDAVIASELTESGIDIQKFRNYNDPHYSVEHTLNGKLDGWYFTRLETTYWLWGDVPLATVEVIAGDMECSRGCMPGQWQPAWGAQPITVERHAKNAEYISWIKDGKFLVQDKGESKEVKDCLQHDANWKLVFVPDPTDPKMGAHPFIQTYTFLTLASLKNFVAIAKRHHLPFSYTH